MCVCVCLRECERRDIFYAHHTHTRTDAHVSIAHTKWIGKHEFAKAEDINNNLVCKRALARLGDSSSATWDGHHGPMCIHHTLYTKHTHISVCM